MIRYLGEEMILSCDCLLERLIGEYDVSFLIL